MLRLAVRCVALRRGPVVTMSSATYYDISDMRKPYRASDDVFDVGNLVSTNPIQQFEAWFNEARAVPNIGEANAMALATASKSGFPSVRMVLMKGFSEKGFTFFTNYESRKAAELFIFEPNIIAIWIRKSVSDTPYAAAWNDPSVARSKFAVVSQDKLADENPVCSLMFYWDPMKRSVRIEGTVERVPEEESLHYFEQRPRKSRLGAIVSHQSTILESREFSMNIQGNQPKICRSS
nr:pyridoxine-5'-phosphate oxidase isoform X3 [Crassostrea gigas]